MIGDKFNCKYYLDSIWSLSSTPHQTSERPPVRRDVRRASYGRRRKRPSMHRRSAPVACIDANCSSMARGRPCYLCVKFQLGGSRQSGREARGDASPLRLRSAPSRLARITRGHRSRANIALPIRRYSMDPRQIFRHSSRLHGRSSDQISAA